MVNMRLLCSHRLEISETRETRETLLFFDEDTTFSSKTEDIREDIKEISLDQLSQLLQNFMIPEPEGDR